jgi:hypothetical protein
VLLLTIPFRSLRFPIATQGSVQQWGMAIIRSIPAKDETDFWPAITNKLSNFMEQFGVMDGMTDVSPGRNVQLTPYGTFAGARFLSFDQNDYATRHDLRVGLDAKLVARDALTFDFTLNPDFSQVESDDPQVTANQRFEVFFPEKRPFFLENSDFFNDTPQTLLFSRRIADPQFGGRMTGKLGRWAIGGLVTDDRAPGRSVPDGGDGTERRAFAGAVRLRRDFANNSRLGLIATTREFGSSSNNVGGLDTRLQFSKKWVFSMQTVGSATTTLSGASTSGISTSADVSRSGRRFTYSFNYSGVSPDFRTELGFVPRVNYHQVTDFLTIRWHPKRGPLIAYGPNSFAQATWDWRGDLRDWIVRIPFQLDFKRQTSLFARHAFIQETVAGVKLRQREDLVQFNSGYFRWLSVNLFLAHGTRPNYYPAEGLLPFIATFTDVGAGATIRPTSALAFDETFFYSTLSARANSPRQGSIFTNPILRSRATYQFTREWSLRAIFDYNSLVPNPSLAGFGRSRHAGVDLLATWLLHPGTALYIGYTDGYDNLRIDPVTGILPTGGRLASTGRQVFVKSSWLVRF